MANEAKPCPCDIGDKIEYGGLGEEVQIEHIKAYVVKPPASEKAIVVIQDIYGWQLPNTRYMADMLSANGYIRGAHLTTGQHFSSGLRTKSLQTSKSKSSINFIFLSDELDHTEVDHIGVVGFCWGGVATHYLALQYQEIKAGVSVYGIVREREDRFDLKSPTLFIFAENDAVIPLDQVTTLETRLKEKCTADFQVKIFPNQTHGFVHRKREDINPDDKLYIEEARTDMINWLNKYM
uniref:Carboxymethylenebutenolidase homolog n=1 Tax=Cyprinus carpio TaxID=7962 RepID=A0A8C2CIY3_CYPCA